MTVNSKRIRESAPFRKSMSMSQEDLDRAGELEQLFTEIFPEDRPFSFSKTISKALEIALETAKNKKELKPIQTTISPDPPLKCNQEKPKAPKIFRNGKRH